MNRRFSIVTVLAALVVTCASIAFAQNPYPNARPMFLAGSNPAAAPPAGSPNLTQWNGSFTDLTQQQINFVMVGTDPAKTNVTTTIPVEIIPLKMVYGPSNGNKTFDPSKNKLPNGQTVLQMILASPILQSNVDFKQGGVDLGKTQYLDAFQRGNFWGKNVKKNNKYHVLLGKPTVMPALTIKVSSSLGSVITDPVKGRIMVGTYDFGTMMNTVIPNYIAKHHIKPNTFPLFVNYDVYLTSGGCCIGGFHFALGSAPTAQTYAQFTAVDNSGIPNDLNFSEDVSAMSHEIGEWMDDPFPGSNLVNCQDNGFMEVGDPLEHNQQTFGDFPYKVGNFTYHLQSLVFLGYFGAPRNTSLLKWLSFQNDEKNVCPGQ